MDEERRSKIAAALHQYRETVSQHNLAMLRILVEGVQARPLKTRPPSYAQELRLTTFAHRGCFGVPESVKELGDLFNDDVRAEVIKRNSLDGVCDTPINLTKREEYFAKIRANLAEKKIDLGDEFERCVAELSYLCTLVDGITGPGLPYYLEPNQIEFITPTVNNLDNLDYIIVPTWDDQGERDDIFLGVWEDWEIAAAFQTGKGSFALCGSCAIYCRNKEDDDNKEWKWRYGMFDGDWHTDMYNSVEEFLGYYAHHNEQTEERVRKDIPRMSYK